MQTPREISENRAMHGIAVALLTEDRNRLSELQRRLEATRLAQVVFSNVGFPIGPTDSILRQIQDLRAEVVIVDISPDNPQPAIRVIELIQSNTLQLAIFANGTMQQPTTIVASMRAGAVAPRYRSIPSDTVRYDSTPADWSTIPMRARMSGSRLAGSCWCSACAPTSWRRPSPTCPR